MTPFSEGVGALYDGWAEVMPDPRVRFLNYGYDGGTGPGDEWPASGNRAPASEDDPDRPHVDLLRHLLHGARLDGAAVLEVGSGRGGNCAWIASRTGARSVIGVDRCLGNVRLSRRGAGGSGAHFLAGDAETLPFAPGCVDVVVSLEAAHCYGRFGRFLHEVRRVLTAGGLLCMADAWDVPLPGVDWAGREEELRAAPFLAEREEDISRGVLRALEAEDSGFFRAFRPEGSGPAATVRRHLTAAARELRNGLAAGVFSYRLWHLRKGEEGAPDGGRP